MCNSIIRTIDVGGNGARMADVQNGKVISDVQEIGPVTDPHDLVSLALRDLRNGTIAISYAMAGIIENHDTLVHSPNAPALKGVSVATLTNDAIGAGSVRNNVAAFNDMEATALGTAVLLPKLKKFYVITLSSGVGGRRVENGVVHNQECEYFGHATVDMSPFAEVCGCGRRGHVEGIAGGEALKFKALQLIKKHNWECLEGEHPTGTLFRRWEEGDGYANEVIQRAIDALGIMLANILSYDRAPAIVFKGTVAVKQLRILKEAIRRAIQRHIIEPSWADSDHLQFIPSPEPVNDQLIGAAACAEAHFGL